MALAGSKEVSPPIVGCCGWREARAKYFGHFPVIELQDTFYEMPSSALAAKWKAAAPPDFLFCLKAWQLITHTPSSPTYRRLKSKVSPAENDLFGSFRATEQVWLAWERTQAVAQALDAAVILFQCPASFRPAAENIRNFREFFGALERGSSRIAWEPRGEWPPDLIRELCSEFDLIHCVDPFKADSVYGSAVYWRLHGRGGYRYVYSEEELVELALRARRCLAEGLSPLYVLFNNLAMASDAVRFQQICGSVGGGSGSGL